jgi:hypothetical protein
MIDKPDFTVVFTMEEIEVLSDDKAVFATEVINRFNAVHLELMSQEEALCIIERVMDVIQDMETTYTFDLRIAMQTVVTPQEAINIVDSITDQRTESNPTGGATMENVAIAELVKYYMDELGVTVFDESRFRAGHYTVRVEAHTDTIKECQRFRIVAASGMTYRNKERDEYGELVKPADLIEGPNQVRLDLINLNTKDRIEFLALAYKKTRIRIEAKRSTEVRPANPQARAQQAKKTAAELLAELQQRKSAQA